MTSSFSAEPWEVANVRPVLDSPHLRMDLATVTKPSGAHEEHYAVQLPAAVVIVALDARGEHVLLARRHRHVPGSSPSTPKRSRRRLAKNAKRTRKELLRETRHATREARQAARALRRIGQQAASNIATELHTRAGEAQTEVAEAARRTRRKTPQARYRYWPWLVAAAIAAAAGIAYMMRHRSTPTAPPATTLHDESNTDSVKTGSDEADGDTNQPPPTVTVQADVSQSE